MATSLKRLVPGSQLTTAAVAYYTAVSVKARIDSIALINTTAGAVTATVHLVPSGGSASVANCVLSGRSIGAGETYIVPGAMGQTIEAGGTLQALASANTSISLVASGIESTA